MKTHGVVIKKRFTNSRGLLRLCWDCQPNLLSTRCLAKPHYLNLYNLVTIKLVLIAEHAFLTCIEKDQRGIFWWLRCMDVQIPQQKEFFAKRFCLSHTTHDCQGVQPGTKRARSEIEHQLRFQICSKGLRLLIELSANKQELIPVILYFLMISMRYAKTDLMADAWI
jgi:hypothetical protein